MKTTILLMLFLCLTTFAQEKTTTEQVNEKEKPKGVIKGRVTSDEGQPLEGVQIYLSGYGENEIGQSLVSDEEGNFKAEGLKKIPYRVSASAKGFVLPLSAEAVKILRVGEFANLSLVKGGVITGRVTDAQGEPVIAARVQAIRVRDDDGKKITENNLFSYRNFKTDDRGVYRIYGLPAGKYIVAVGGKPANSWGAQGSRESDVPTFYPASTRDTAVDVSVNLGEEIANINIRYRGEIGYSISGIVTGQGAEHLGQNVSIAITLLSSPNHVPQMTTGLFSQQSNRTFAFYGVPDGEYELLANTNAFNTNSESSFFMSPARRVSVKGGNVENLTLSMSPLSSIRGNVVIENPAEKSAQNVCKSERQSMPDEIILKIMQDAGGKPEPYDPWLYDRTTAPTEKGEIKFNNLFAGRYFLQTQLPDENWYVKSISLPAVAVAKTTAKIDVGKQGISVSAGEKRTDLLLTISSGATALSGKLVSAPNKTLPTRMRIHLVPAEKDAADDFLRYAEYKTKADGAFQFANLAPGKYWLVTRSISEEESDEKKSAPLTWDAAKRIALRREAEAKNELLELSSCQPRRNYELKINPGK